MQRLHVHVTVSDLRKSIAFYSALFGTGPSVLKPDYAKWMLDDPRVNFAISGRGAAAGVDHLGIQVESDGELEAVARRLSAAGERVAEQRQAECCYARSNKAWAEDPDGVSWETFRTTGAAATYGVDADAKAQPRAKAAACCGAGTGEPACCG